MSALDRATEAVLWTATDHIGGAEARAIARAVLVAVRDPDEAIVDVGHEDSPYVDWHDVSDIFTAMIDAILNETP